MSVADDVTTVLDFNLPELRPGKASPPWDGRPTAHFFWPAFCRQMLVRERRRRVLNLFQEYVLRLCQAGFRTHRQISDSILPGLEPLVARIAGELEAFGATDGAGAVTRLGEEMLQGEACELEEPTSLYLFEDPWTGRLWNRFPESLRSALIEVRWQETEEGLVAKPVEGKDRVPGYVVDPGRLQPKPRPDEAAIKELFSSFRRDWEIAARAMGSDDDDRIGHGPPAVLGEIVRIYEPKPVYLRALAFLPERGPWRAADPFGLGVNPDFRAQLDEFGRGPEGAGFFGWLRAQLSKGEPESRRTLAEKAEKLVDDALGSRLDSHPQLYEELLAAQRAALAVKARRGGVQSTREARDAVQTAILKAQVALEWLFKIIGQECIDPSRRPGPAYGAFDLVPGDRKASAAELARVAKRLGFKGELPDRLTHVDAGKIRSAADHGRGSLNALVWAAVLEAAYRSNESHPMAGAAHAYPDMLADLSRIAELRDEVAHAVTNPLDFAHEVDALIAKTYRIIDILLPKY